jgi:hypothetical protein
MSKHLGQVPLEIPRRARAIAAGRKAKSGRFLTGQAQSRRQLLAGVLRYATLGMLGTAGGFVVARRRRLVREGKCINSGICRGCEIFEKCDLPQALSAKQVLARMGDGGK